MKVWSVPFHVIENEWTDDQFMEMLDRLSERIEREQKEVDNNNRKTNSARSGSSRRTEKKSMGAAEFAAGA